MKRNSEKTKIIIDWITFFPAAMLSSALAWTVVYQIVQWGLKQAIGLDSPAAGVLLQLMPNVAFGAAGVYVAAKIAPSQKKLVAISLGVLVFLMAGTLGYFAVERKAYWDLIGSVGMVLGALGIVWKPPRKMGA